MSSSKSGSESYSYSYSESGDGSGEEGSKKKKSEGESSYSYSSEESPGKDDKKNKKDGDKKDDGSSYSYSYSTENKGDEKSGGSASGSYSYSYSEESEGADGKKDGEKKDEKKDEKKKSEKKSTSGSSGSYSYSYSDESGSEKDGGDEKKTSEGAAAAKKKSDAPPSSSGSSGSYSYSYSEEDSKKEKDGKGDGGAPKKEGKKSKSGSSGSSGSYSYSYSDDDKKKKEESKSSSKNGDSSKSKSGSSGSYSYSYSDESKSKNGDGNGSKGSGKGGSKGDSEYSYSYSYSDDGGGGPDKKKDEGEKTSGVADKKDGDGSDYSYSYSYSDSKDGSKKNGDGGSSRNQRDSRSPSRSKSGGNKSGERKKGDKDSPSYSYSYEYDSPYYSYSYTGSSDGKRSGGDKGRKRHGEDGEGEGSASYYTESEYMSDFTRERMNPPLRDWFSDLPEPDTKNLIVRETQDNYFRSIQENIRRLRQHIRRIQMEECDVIEKYCADLQKDDEQRGARGASSSVAKESGDDDGVVGGTQGSTIERGQDKETEKKRQEFLETLGAVRKQRKQYRALLYDAITQRNNMIEAAEIRYEAERAKDLALWSLGRHRDVDYFLFFLFSIEMIVILLFIIFVDFDLTTGSLLDAQRGTVNSHMDPYQAYRNIALMLFAGFGLLLTFVRKYAYSGITYAFLISGLSMQWAIIWLGLLEERARYTLDPANYEFQKIFIGIPDMVQSIFAASAVAISFGSVLGRLDPLQLAVMAVFETLCWSINIWIAWILSQVPNVDPTVQVSEENLFGLMLGRIDPGGSMFIHFFGAFFGLVVGVINARTRKNDDREYRTEYSSNTFALLGTCLLIALFPAFNAAFAMDGTQYRVIFNTIFAIVASVTAAFSFSHCLPMSRNKFGLVEIHHATLAGGIMIGATSTYLIPPVAALVLGWLGGMISVMCYMYVTPLLRTLTVGDTNGSLSLHGIPGILGALVGIVLVAISESLYPGGYPFTIIPSDIYNRSGPTQAPLQAAILAVTIAITFVGGLITGVVILVFNMCFPVRPEAAERYQDDRTFHVPVDYVWRPPPSHT